MRIFLCYNESFSFFCLRDIIECKSVSVFSQMPCQTPFVSSYPMHCNCIPHPTLVHQLVLT